MTYEFTTQLSGKLVQFLWKEDGRRTGRGGRGGQKKHILAKVQSVQNFQTGLQVFRVFIMTKQQRRNNAWVYFLLAKPQNSNFSFKLLKYRLTSCTSLISPCDAMFNSAVYSGSGIDVKGMHASVPLLNQSKSFYKKKRKILIKSRVENQLTVNQPREVILK